jgi:hypothetical protein
VYRSHVSANVEITEMNKIGAEVIEYLVREYLVRVVR